MRTTTPSVLLDKAGFAMIRTEERTNCQEEYTWRAHLSLPK